MHPVGTSEDLRDDEALVAVRSLGGTAPDAAVREQVAALRGRWSAPERGYHDTEHLAEVLDRLDELAGPVPAPADLVLAAWFHDAVYEGRQGRDERDSAELARSVLAGLGVPAAAAGRVAELVLVTADHVPADGDDDAAMLCDADLAVLASAAERYDRYVAGVVHEYRHLPGPLFRRGRRQVLRRLLARAADPSHADGPLYRTAVARERWAAAAVANLERELAGGAGDLDGHSADD